MVPAPMLGAVVGILAAQAVLAGFFLARQRGDRSREVEGDLVTCPHCGAKNERGYTFCRRCVRELPGGTRTREARSTLRYTP